MGHISRPSSTGEATLCMPQPQRNSNENGTLTHYRERLLTLAVDALEIPDFMPGTFFCKQPIRC